MLTIGAPGKLFLVSLIKFYGDKEMVITKSPSRNVWVDFPKTDHYMTYFVNGNYETSKTTKQKFWR
jgi:hypothetical protein